VADALGNPLPGDFSGSWIMDTTPPAVQILPVSPDPRTGPVDSLQLVFSEPVSGLDLGDLSLELNGSGNLLAGTETLQTTDNLGARHLHLQTHCGRLGHPGPGRQPTPERRHGELDRAGPGHGPQPAGLL